MADMEGMADVVDADSGFGSSPVDDSFASPLRGAIDLRPALTIILIVAVSSLAVEFLSWLVVYRTADYKRLVREVEDQHKAFAKLRGAPASDKDLPRKRKKLDEAMLKTSREFASSVRMKTGAFTFVLLFFIYRVVVTKWAGVVVARLPFDPPGILTRMSHSGLDGDDMRDCSALFIYVLCGLAVRSNITKFLNLGPNRAISASTMPQNVMDKTKYD